MLSHIYFWCLSNIFTIVSHIITEWQKQSLDEIEGNNLSLKLIFSKFHKIWLYKVIFVFYTYVKNKYREMTINDLFRNFQSYFIFKYCTIYQTINFHLHTFDIHWDIARFEFTVFFNRGKIFSFLKLWISPSILKSWKRQIDENSNNKLHYFVDC